MALPRFSSSKLAGNDVKPLPQSSPLGFVEEKRTSTRSSETGPGSYKGGQYCIFCTKRNKSSETEEQAETASCVGPRQQTRMPKSNRRETDARRGPPYLIRWSTSSRGCMIISGALAWEATGVQATPVADEGPDDFEPATLPLPTVVRAGEGVSSYRLQPTA